VAAAVVVVAVVVVIVVVVVIELRMTKASKSTFNKSGDRRQSKLSLRIFKKYRPKRRANRNMGTERRLNTMGC